MKTLVLLFLFFSVQAAFAFENGTYKCVEANYPGICEQSLVFKTNSDKTQTLEVRFTGACKEGPYTYACESDTKCGDPSASFEKIDNKSYVWENLDSFIYCRFVKVK